MKRAERSYRMLGSSMSLFLILLSALPVWGATYYVKSGGNDTLDGLSDATAWATPTKVQAMAKSGDIVYFRSNDTWKAVSGPGVLVAKAGVTYDGSTYGSGTRAKFVAAGGYNGGNYGVVTIYASDVVLRGFEIDGGSFFDEGIDIGFYAGVDLSNITVDNCFVHHVGNPTDANWPYGIIVTANGTHTTRNVTITNTEVSFTARGGINLYASWTTFGNTVDTVLVRNCYVHDCGLADGHNAAAIDIANDIRNATIEFCRFDHNGAGISSRVSPEIPSNIARGPENINIMHNIISNNNVYGVLGTSILSLPQKINYYGNLFIDNGKTDNVKINGGNGAEVYLDQGNSGSVFNILNNTFYTVTNPNRNWSGVALFGLGDPGNVGATINFKNNIVYAGVKSSDATFRTIWDRWNVLTHSNNLVFRASGPNDLHVFVGVDKVYTRSTMKTVWEPSGYNTAPNFVGGPLPTGFTGTYGTNLVPNTNYFAISSGDAIDNGFALGSPFVGCINGAGLATPILRPQGAAYDIGAYEYTGSVIGPSSPTSLRTLAK